MFILTDNCGKRQYGTCGRFLAHGSGPRYPCCVVLLTVNRPEQHLLEQLLQVAATKVAHGCSCVPLLAAALACPMPSQLHCSTEDVVVCVTPEEKYRFSRPPERDNMFEQLAPLLHNVSSRDLLQLFAHLMHERRVIFCASSLQVLSTGVQSTLALLYPFSWQHVYVPVLPEGLINFCCAPMPFVVGLLSSHLAELSSMTDAMEDVVIFDLDQSQFLIADARGKFEAQPLVPLAPDLLTIPETYRIAIMRQVDSARKAERNGSIKQGKMLARPFLAFFVQMFWNFRRFFDAAQGGFDKKAFVDSKCSPASRAFMSEFIDSQMACQFLQEYEQTLRKGHTARFAAFERLTDYVEQQFESALKEMENANPRERFKRRMSRILPFSQSSLARKSGQNLLTPQRSLQRTASFASEPNQEIEIVKKPGQVSSFGLPLSTMMLKMPKPNPLASSPSANLLAPQDIGSPMSPFKICGKVDRGRSPCIFSPHGNGSEDDDSVEKDTNDERRLVHSDLHFVSVISSFGCEFSKVGFLTPTFLRRDICRSFLKSPALFQRAVCTTPPTLVLPLPTLPLMLRELLMMISLLLQSWSESLGWILVGRMIGP